MHGVTTAIVAFIFICILFPRIVKNRPQFHFAVVGVVLLILVDALAVMIQSPGFSRFAGGFSGVIQVMSFLLLFMATGGLSLKDLTGEFKSTIEVMRRGEETTEILIPRRGQQGASAAAPAEDVSDWSAGRRRNDPPPPPVHHINERGEEVPTVNRPPANSPTIPME